MRVVVATVVLVALAVSPYAAAEPARLLEHDLAPPAPEPIRIGLRRPDEGSGAGARRGMGYCYACGASAILPGVGQFLNGEPLKGGLLLLGAVITSSMAQAFHPGSSGFEGKGGIVFAVDIGVFAVLWVYSMFDAFVVAAQQGW